MEVYLYQDYHDNRGLLNLDGRPLVAPGPAHLWVTPNNIKSNTTKTTLAKAGFLVTYRVLSTGGPPGDHRTPSR